MRPSLPTFRSAIPLLVCALCGAIAASWAVWLKYYWFHHVPPGYVFYGYLQGDQKIYIALIRWAMKSPNGFTYSYPWDLSPDAPAIFFQLPIWMMAWLARLLPSVQFHDLFDIFRMILAPGMYFYLGRMTQLYFPRGGGRSRLWFWIVFLTLGFGGGIAWVWTAMDPGWTVENKLTQFLVCHEYEEKDYRWWFLNVFRNVYYSFEVLYHLLFLGMAVYLIRGRYVGALCFYALGLTANPFLGIQMTALLLPALAVDAWRPSRTSCPRWSIFPALFLLGLFAGYYYIFLNLWPVGRSLREQHSEAYSLPLSFWDIFLGYAPFLLFFAISWFIPGFAKRQCKSRGRLILLLWLGGSFLLTQNSRFLPHGVQPMHFTRGYLYPPLAIWFFQTLRRLAAGWGISRSRGLYAGMIIFAALLLPDNILLIVRQHFEPATEFTTAEDEV
ncbi:hypothetical protein HYR69_02140, partial [Candidatus Sumerlaeota bacterium]|nr:hypothetical protein [Candidatus Sumerlaeota bacterium]